MKNLIIKDLTLAVHPTFYVFTALGALVLVPSYPFGAIFLFGCLASYISFQYGRETQDVYFTALLPVSRKQIVQSKVLLCVLCECVQLVISVPFAALRPFLFPQGNVAGMDANVAFYGFAFLAYGVYNAVFVSEFYKTAYKAGAAFVKAIVPVSVVIIVMETVSHIPAVSFIDGVSAANAILQLPFLVVGLAVFAIGNIVAFRVGVRRFAVVDI